MDLWVVAAAAGAGYLTKYWQNISKSGDKDGLLNLPFGDANLDKSESSGHPLHRLGHRKKVGDDVSTDRKKASDAYLLESSCGTEVASTSGYDGEKLRDLVKYKDCNVLSLSHMSPVYLGNENENENGDGAWINHDIDDGTGAILPKSSSGERDSYHVPLKNKSSVRTKRSYGHVIKPVNSLESCLMAQLYKEHAEEEHVLTLPSPSSPSMRPLFVTDGNRIISKASGDHFGSQIGIKENKLHKEAYLETNENACGVPPEPKLGYLDLPKKMKSKTGKGRHGKLSSASKSVNGKHLHSEVMREFLWGAVAGAFGEGMMHPVDTVKTRIQSQAILSASQKPKSIRQMVRAAWLADGLRGIRFSLCRGPGVTGSLATGATYFGVIESTKKWIEESHPSLEGRWAHFIAGAVGDTLGSVVYVPCEVMKQRMQVQGTMASWSYVVMKGNIAMKPGIQCMVTILECSMLAA